MILFFSMFYLWINSSLKFPRIFIFTFLPVIVLLIYSSFSVLVLANKGISLWDSFKYSFSVVKGRWLKVFMFILIIYVLSALTSVTVGIPYIFLSRNLFTELIFNTIVNVICSFFVILNTVLFINFDDTKLL